MKKQDFINLIVAAKKDQHYNMIVDDFVTHGYIWNVLIVPDVINASYEKYLEYKNYKPSTISLSVDNHEWLVSLRVDVVDDDGEVLDKDSICDILIEYTDIRDFDVSVFGEDELLIIDGDKTMDMFTVVRDEDRDIKFAGEVLAVVSSSDNNARSDYSGSVGRWSEYSLYRTKSGKYICARIEHTRWQGERDKHYGCVCETTDEVFDFFGNDRLAKELYDAVGLENVELVY